MSSFAASRQPSAPGAPHRATASIAVTAIGEESSLQTAAGEIAQELALPFVTAQDNRYDLLLVLTAEHLELRDNSARSGIGRASARPEGRRAPGGAHHKTQPQGGP